MICNGDVLTIVTRIINLGSTLFCITNDDQTNIRLEY
jgi:hypothetical protein